MIESPSWLKAIPLENFSSLSEISLGRFCGLQSIFQNRHLFLQFSFNLHTPLTINPLAYLAFDMCDANKQPACDKCCYSILGIKRWRLPIEGYKTIKCFLKHCKSEQRNKYNKTKKVFNAYGCRTEYLEKDWSSFIPQIYSLYCNTASRHGTFLYDLSFFEKCAKREDCSLLTAWYDKTMIGMTILQQEGTTLHSICGGFDYVHSSPSYTYSWLNYVLIEMAILSGKYKEIDVGITADIAKSNIGYHSIPSRLDVYSKGFFTRSFLSVISPFVKTTFDRDGKFKLTS